MKLFKKRKRKRKRKETNNNNISINNNNNNNDDDNNNNNKQIKKMKINNNIKSFSSLNLLSWINESCEAMGFYIPTPIQSMTIPSILQGHDILACAETGSGKTAAFALPILNQLSIDPYGVYAIILTPTRELAMQIFEQFQVLGSPINVRLCLAIGGISMLKQSIGLQRIPHIIIGTPGRVHYLLKGPNSPHLLHLKFCVFDEADRLIADGFQEDLNEILNLLPNNRQNLAFSATMEGSEQTINKLSMKNPIFFNLTEEQNIPETLKQEYIFLPEKLKLPYLVELFLTLIQNKSMKKQKLSINNIKNKKKQKKHHQNNNNNNNNNNNDNNNNPKTIRSVMVFVDTCRNCQELTETLLNLKIECVSLHSLMTQHARINAIGKFKSSYSKILISTDVGSRGLDIPQVDLVINYNISNDVRDYVHRVGRTARAGRRGRAITFITQNDLFKIKKIEEHINKKLVECTDIERDNVLSLINTVAKSHRLGKLKLIQNGFDDLEDKMKERKIKQRNNNKIYNEKKKNNNKKKKKKKNK